METTFSESEQPVALRFSLSYGLDYLLEFIALKGLGFAKGIYQVVSVSTDKMYFKT